MEATKSRLALSDQRVAAGRQDKGWTRARDFRGRTASGVTRCQLTESEGLSAQGRRDAERSGRANLDRQLRPDEVGVASFVHQRPGTPLPYFCRTRSMFLRLALSKLLILLASPTGFEPVLPP